MRAACVVGKGTYTSRYQPRKAEPPEDESVRQQKRKKKSDYILEADRLKDGVSLAVGVPCCSCQWHHTHSARSICYAATLTDGQRRIELDSARQRARLAITELRLAVCDV